MSDEVRWVVVVVLVVLVVGLVGYARGPEHHRGDEVGARPTGGTPTQVVTP